MTKSLKIDERLEKYITEHSYELHPIQKELLSHNNKLGDLKKKQVSITQAYFFQFLIKTNNIKSVLEVGTFTGYSALSMGLSLPHDGKIVCLDINKETSTIAGGFFKKANLENKIKIILGPANETLDQLNQNKKKFDLIFIDADKENYKNYYEKCFELLKKKGFILIDNVLWHGDVADPSKNDRLTKIIREFNSFIRNDDRITRTILPLGDGITICRKI